MHMYVCSFVYIVFAYINGLTNSEELGKQGWRGSVRRLAKVLHVSPSSMNDIINRLEEKAYVRIYNGHILSNFRRDVPGQEKAKEATVQNPDTFLGQYGRDEPF